MAERGDGSHSPAIVARGKIKVDARKAISKLRDHLLVDLHLYSTEIARVAVAMGARSLAVEWDADDVVISFDGRALPREAVARARDHVLTPETDLADGDALRVLGIGISAALGTNPAFVDVFTSDATGCARVRFEAKHIDEEAFAAAPEPVEVAPPAGMPRAGMRVHVRRRVSMAILARAVRRDVPREVLLLVAATRDSPLVVTVNGARAGRPPGPTVLVRVDLDEPSATRASLEVLMPQRGVRPSTLFLDLGVHLAESTGIGLRETDDGELPVRVVIDARALPTNASRSEVRMDADVVRRIRTRVPAALAAALAVLEAVVVRGDAPPRGPVVSALGLCVELMEAPRALYEEALGAIAADVAIAVRAGTKVSEAETALLKLPLLCDAVGMPLSLAELRGGTPEQPLLVYTGHTPAPRELAAWLSGVVWQRGRAVEHAIAVLAQTSANPRVAQAHEGRVRQRRAMEHPPSRAVLPASASYVLKEAFAVSSGPYAGLEGEVAVMQREGGYRKASTVRMFVDGRLLETIQLPAVALPVDMALSWPAGIVATLSYDGVERDERLSRAIVYALRIASLAVGERLGPRDPELARLAILACVSATQTLGDASPPRSALGSLAKQAVWPTSDGSLVTLVVIEAYVNRTGALCVARAGAGRAADGRPVIVTEHGKALQPLLRAGTVIVDYGRMLERSATEVADGLALQALGCLVKVTFQRTHIEGFVGVGPNRRRILHRGQVLRDEAFMYRNGPVLVVLEDRTAVPTGDHGSGSVSGGGGTLLWSSHAEYGTAREEDALLELVVDGCERGDIDLATVQDYVASARRKLGERLKAGRQVGDAARETALLGRLEDLPARLARERLARAKAAVLARPARPALGEGHGDGRGSLSATVAARSGTVTVTLLRDMISSTGSGEVLFEGHPVESTTVLDLPLSIRVDVSRESLLKDWATLSDEGRQWARERATEATLKLLGNLARGEGFTSDIHALRLCEQLLLRDAHVKPRVALMLRVARWPTVQGATTSLASTGSLSFGSDTYAPYRAAKDLSPFDEPALHLPRSSIGELRRNVLKHAGFELVDHTEPIARLQALRARGASVELPPPCLPGAPVHPRLRESLAKLGATLAEGELELTEAPSSEITRVDGRGAAELQSFALEVPVRAIFRAGDGSTEQLVTELSLASVRHLRALAARGGLDALPAFVRDRLRALVCSRVERGRRSATDDSHPVFVDKEGAYWSLARLIELGTVRHTIDPGPWLIREVNAPILVLSAAEARALSSVLRLQDVTEELRTKQRGAERRAAPPLERMSLSPEQRAHCLHVFTVDEEGLRGEVGLLRPAHANHRALNVHTAMRPLATIADGASWPTVAAIDVDDVTASSGFDALEDRIQIGQIQRRVRAAISARAVELLPAPSDATAMGVVRLPVPFMARRPDAESSDLPVACLGIFWLTPQWPEAPTVHLEAADGIDPFRQPIMASKAGARHRLLPISGRIWVCAGQHRVTPALEHVFDFLLDRLAPIVASASRTARAAPADERAAYAWDLRLLGALTDVNPVQELALDRPDPILMRVAARRVPHLIDEATGDAPANAAAPAPTSVRAPAAARAAHQGIATRAPAVLAGFVADVARQDAAPPGETFLRGLVRRVVELVTPAPEPVSESPLTRSLTSAIAAMKLTGDPVGTVVEASRGRPVRYESKKKRVLVNVSHASIRALETHPSRVLLLLAAAISEINRELVPVTDAEELAVIVDLLREG